MDAQAFAAPKGVGQRVKPAHGVVVEARLCF
jgi:hypothetical protein